MWEFLALIRAGGVPGMVRRRRYQTNHHHYTFSIHCLNFVSAIPSTVPRIVISHYDDVQTVFAKQRKLELPLTFPSSLTRIHGRHNLQELSGSNHAVMRKLFSSLLSPRALDGFLPHILDTFTRFWQHVYTETQQQNNNKDTTNDKTIIFRNHIRQFQFELMAKILYGMDVAEEPDLVHRLQRNFELEDAALFAPLTSATFRDGLAASQETRGILWQRFQTILQQAQQDHNNNNNKNQTNKKASSSDQESLPPIGNAFQAIAQAVVESGKATDDETLLSAIQDNLLLLLEAAHGTTMYVTTTILYYLFHPNHAAALQRVRSECQHLMDKNDKTVQPTVSDLKDGLPFCDAVIQEAQRLCPIVGLIVLYMSEGKVIELPKRHLPANQQKDNMWRLEGPLVLKLMSDHWYRDERAFPNADQFCPQRWMPCSNKHYPDDGQDMTDWAPRTFAPFGGGNHICLGMHLAKLVLKANMLCLVQARVPSPNNTDSSLCSLKVVYDPQKVFVQNGVFPQFEIKDGMPCQVVADEEASKEEPTKKS